MRGGSVRRRSSTVHMEVSACESGWGRVPELLPWKSRRWRRGKRTGAPADPQISFALALTSLASCPYHPRSRSQFLFLSESSQSQQTGIEATKYTHIDWCGGANTTHHEHLQDTRYRRALRHCGSRGWELIEHRRLVALGLHLHPAGQNEIFKCMRPN